MGQNTEKDVIIAQMVSEGLPVEEAEANYQKLFGKATGAQLPFPLLKVNNVKGVADIGQLVGGAQRDEAGEIVGYDTILDFKDIDFTIITKAASWQAYDSTQNRTTVKTKWHDVMTGKARFVDSFSGRTIADLHAEGNPNLKYQVLAVVGVREKGSDAPFELHTMYIKGAVLAGMNRLFDTYKNEAPYSIANIVTSVGKTGAVRYAEINLDKSEVRPFATEDTLGNLGLLLDAVKQFDEYVEAYNSTIDVAVNDTEGLPE